MLALRPQLDPEALERWCWALAVLEHRPYLAERNAQRQDYIDSHRERVL